MSEYKRTALVLGAGGFIGSHMVKRLRAEGYWVRGVDLKHTEFSKSEAHEFVEGDLRDVRFVRECIQFKGYPGNFNANVPYQYIQPFDEIYQFAADMGGAGFIFTGENDADIMHNSASINLNLLEEVRKLNETFDGEVKEWTEANRPKLNQPTKIFYSSSACIYPEYAQEETNNPGLKENDAYPAAPDSEYGWEKLFSERLYFSYNRNHGIPVRVARYHNILQTRSFLFIDECIEATRRLMDSDFMGPVNIGSEEMVTINQLVETAAKVAGKDVQKLHIDGPTGVRGRNSNNDLIREELGWDYSQTLEEGIAKTYAWILNEINRAQR